MPCRPRFRMPMGMGPWATLRSAQVHGSLFSNRNNATCSSSAPEKTSVNDQQATFFAAVESSRLNTLHAPATSQHGQCCRPTVSKHVAVLLQHVLCCTPCPPRNTPAHRLIFHVLPTVAHHPPFASDSSTTMSPLPAAHRAQCQIRSIAVTPGSAAGQS
jgi:hypothetical protein